MLDTLLDNYNKAVKSTLELQQEMLRKWTDQLTPSGSPAPAPKSAGTPSSSGAAATTAAGLEHLSAAKKKWEEMVAEMLNRHRETLDEQYRAGIRALDDAFRAAEAKDPEKFRQLSEELWRRTFATLETAVSSQIHDVQAVFQKWLEATSEAVKGSMGGHR